MKGIDHKSKFLLTHREREVFELLVQDKTTRDIAGQLFISEKTVRNHISNVMYFEIVYKIGRINGWKRVRVCCIFLQVDVT
ncbi:MULTISPECIES: helix-turn-helix domain-containing protein [unclassified Paenibacillus]|uniref:helix-turn-helix domain-containing protein n=1 Tax=unclassified Paenibacillus TaxID=185978 RepID=UPI00278996F8|nr:MULTISPECIES: helix-turn-helix transcriptional regulator [unclassified Paenibacillus]MDQ0724624.1 FixJ family two-component response regulator [Paenibacillus sp. W4I10]